ncbi:MAG: APC family permease [Bacilli bacterium]
MSVNISSKSQQSQSAPDSEPRKLAKRLNWLMVIAFGLASEVGAGIFFVSAQVQGIVPGVGGQVPIAILTDGLIALFLGFTYWYFSGSLAGAGGEYLFVSRALGPRFGFVVHVVSWFGATASVGFLAYIAPTFIAAALSSIAPGLGQVLTTPMGEFTAGLAMIWLAWALHVRGVHLVGFLLQGAMAVILLAGALVVAVGLSHSPAALFTALAARQGLVAASLMNHAPPQTTAAFFSVLPLLYFAYSGLRSATYTGGETPNAKGVVGKSILVLVVVVTIFYTAFAAALYHVVPWQLLYGLLSHGHKSLASASALIGLLLPPWLDILLNFAVAFIVFKTILPGMMAQSRMMVAFVADGLLPARLARLSKHRTPTTALTIGAVMASVVLLQTSLTGTAFGLASSVLAGTVVHFALGLGIVILPKTAPALYAANSTWLKGRRSLQWGLGLIMMAVAAALAYLVVVPSLNAVWYFNPLFQVAVFAAIGWIVYSRYWRSVVERGDVARHKARFSEEPSI